MLLTDSGSTTPVDASSQARVQFALSQTPYVDNISPRNGSARGGDVITITGSGFSQTLEHNSVFLNGIPCETISVAGDSTELTCISGPRVSINPITTRVHVAGKGDAVVAPLAQFRYIDLWSDRRTWLNEEPPIDGDTVVVPPGQAVLLDINAPKLFVLLVQGEMIFDNKDLTLDASYIVVQGGLLQIGTEEEPFHHRATITVHGDRWKSIALPRMGAKNIVILDRYWSTGGDPLALGRLEIHGRPRQRTWTKVASSIAAGSTLVETAEDVDFEPGETIIVTAGGRIGGFSQTEERIVAARPGPRQIVLTEPLQFDHESEIFEFEGTEIDMRCEVGIISRNIVVQGDDNSPKQLFGVHTMTAVGGSYRVENAEFRNCGQSFNMGRYCTHFHIAGFQAHSYVKSNSIHHSFQRATTVHGTHHTLVKNNVAHYIRGHNYFVEDGIEMKNVIEANLGAHTLRCFSCLKSDTKPATFWMAGPNNIWRHNVAAGSINDGYWFEPPGHPHGPSFTTTVCPGHEHLEEFFNNTAHSNGVHGLRIYPHWTPLVDPCDDESGPFPVYLHNFTSFHNGQHGIFTKISGDIHHIDAKLVENGDDEVFWTKLENTVYKWDPHFKNLLAIASRAGQRDGKHGIFGPQNEYFYVDGATFVNYGNPGVLAACAKCASQTDMKQGGYTYRYQNLRFVNSPKKTHWTLPRKQIFWDVDGSLTGIANGTVLPFYEFNAWPECTHEGEEYDDGMICDSSVRVRRVVIDGVEPQELDFKNAIVTGRSNRHPSVDSAEWGLENSTKPDVIQFWPKEEYGWVVPLVTSHRYHFDFDSTIDFQKMRLKYGEYALIDEGWTPAASPADASRGTLDPAGEWVALAFNYTDRRWNFEVTYAEGKRPWLNTLEVPAPDDDLGTGSMINNTKEWHVMLNDKNITLDTPSKYQFNVFPLQCPPDGCYVPPPPDWRTPVYWSSPSTWPNGFLPQAGENVVINSTTYVIMDINPPPLGKVEVQGRLDFGENGDRTLEADSLVVYGHLQIGESQRRPYPRQAKILLKGSRNSEAVIVDNTLFLGNKVMVVVGTALLYGKPVTDTWVRLRSTASAGSSTIELHSDPGWAVGSEIVLTTTEYGLEQTETRTITSKSGRQLTLNAPLTYSHYAGVVSVTDPDNHAATKDIALRGAVGLLSRNIKIEGKVASDTDGYGAHVVVAEIPPTSHGSQSGQERARIGKLEAYYVGFEKTGKQSSEHPSVLFKYQFNGESPAPQNEPDTIPSNVLEGCAFAHTLNYAVVAQMARNVRLIGNVFHRTFRSAVDFDARSTNATIDGNLVAGSHRSPDEVDTWVSPIAAFYIGVPVRSMSNNLAAGSDDAGFVFRPDLCSEAEVQLGTGAGASRAGGAGAGTSGGSAATHAVHHNEAVGCVIGGWILPRTRTCVSVTDFTAWKNSHIGLFTIDQTANLVVQRAVVADNHIGMSFNFFRAAAYNQVDIRSSVVIGSSSASTCDDSTQCRAVAQNDVKGQGCNSVFGRAFRRVSVILPQYLNRAKTCDVDQGLEVCRPPTRPERLCGLPWEKRYGLPSASNAYMNVSSVTFAQFARDDCDQRSVAFAWNPTQQDWSPSTGFSNIAWSNTPNDARFLLDK
ncbi:PKHD1L1, partial [Symbiodinium sp. KB8]